MIGENSVSVVVATKSGTLEGADVAKITDIVLGETNFPANAVKVVLAENSADAAESTMANDSETVETIGGEGESAGMENEAGVIG